MKEEVVKKYYVKDLAKMFGMSEHTIRFYDKKNLFNGFMRNESGYRFVEEEGLKFFELIICLKKTGMSLEGIREYLALIDQGDASLEARHQIIKNQLDEAVHKREDINAQIKYLEYKMNLYEEIKNKK